MIYGVPITLSYTTWSLVDNAPIDDDPANHSLFWIKDGTSAPTTNTPIASTVVGECNIDLTSSETQAHTGKLVGTTTTDDVIIIPVSVSFQKLPDATPGTNGGLPTVDINNYIAGIQGTVNTLDELGTRIDTSISNLNDITVSDILSATISGSITLQDALSIVVALAKGKVVMTSPNVYVYYDTDGVTPIYTLTITQSGRTST